MRVALVVLLAVFYVWALGYAYDAEAGKPRAAASPAVRIGDGTLIDAIVRERARTWRCQRQLGRNRSPVSYQAERSPSLAFRKWTHRLWKRRAGFNCNAARQLADPVRAIYAVWGSRASEAVRVARCESGLSIYARNGRYAGLFQVSDHWRATVPGWGYTALAQATHAYRVFRLTGSTWAHWSCKP